MLPFGIGLAGALRIGSRPALEGLPAGYGWRPAPAERVGRGRAKREGTVRDHDGSFPAVNRGAIDAIRAL